MIKDMVDCRRLGFSDGAEAIIYMTSHDVEGNNRFYTYLQKQGVPQDQVIRRIKLGFACLLTAVGIPMILAGEEFGDQHDLFDAHGNVTQDGGKQVDPVNYGRADEPERAVLLSYVSKLVALRTTHPALGVNDAQFLHVDLNDGKRVVVWMRGNVTNPIIVIANFSTGALPIRSTLLLSTSFPGGLAANGRRSPWTGRHLPPEESPCSLGRQKSIEEPELNQGGATEPARPP